MRDIKRIDTFLLKLKEVWVQYPDLRFAQVIDILKFPDEYKNKDPFFFEEEDWVKIFDNTIKK